LGSTSRWHAKAMEAAERADGADLDSLITLWVETKEVERRRRTAAARTRSFQLSAFSFQL
jgi:hypothetical protein